jgi:hypothetical protein
MSQTSATKVKSVRTAALELLQAGRPGDAGWYVDYPERPKAWCIWRLVGPFPTRLEAEAFNVLVHPAGGGDSGVYEYTAEELEHGKAHARDVGYSEVRLLDLMDSKAVNVPVARWGRDVALGLRADLVEEVLKRAAAKLAPPPAAGEVARLADDGCPHHEAQAA